MKFLEDIIISHGEVLPGDVLKVDSFLNHQINIEIVRKLAEEFFKIFKNEKITKILTIEASGISIACLTAMQFGCPVLYAKKNKSSNVGSDVLSTTVYSYTHNVNNSIIVSKKYISEDDCILIIDDFLAKGSALTGLIEIVNKSGAKLVGAGIVIEKAYQDGGAKLRESGVRIESLAKIKSMSTNGSIEFCE